MIVIPSVMFFILLYGWGLISFQPVDWIMGLQVAGAAAAFYWALSFGMELLGVYGTYGR